jgi:hypothetical protein
LVLFVVNTRCLDHALRLHANTIHDLAAVDRGIEYRQLLSQAGLQWVPGNSQSTTVFDLGINTPAFSDGSLDHPSQGCKKQSNTVFPNSANIVNCHLGLPGSLVAYRSFWT